MTTKRSTTTEILLRRLGSSAARSLDNAAFDLDVFRSNPDFELGRQLAARAIEETKAATRDLEAYADVRWP